ncbi:hypothetical protein SB00610_04722 [Klebsiella quasipneumoniae subsp. similipneumoniae]|nr:hypothetical protein SB00610_04722 [Klebsiella quasipneumoniae subsp. similipneumoniae]
MIAVEIENQLLAGGERLLKVEAKILFVQHIFDMRRVQRAAELVVEPVACPAEGEAFQTAVVAVVTFTLLIGQVAGVNVQTVDFA